jgi:hypothetical protein
MLIKIAGVYFAYNRPELIEKTLSKFSKFDFYKLVIFIDGPKNKNDEIKVNQTISEVKKIVKKLKNVELNINKINKTIDIQILESLNYIFDRYEAAIVLEDDSVPSDTFFNFCKQIINFHNKDENVAAISGTNFLNIKFIEDYYFTKYFFPWGWASWRRFWKSMSIDKNNIRRFQKSKKYDLIFPNIVENNYWKKIFQDRNFEIPFDNYVFMNMTQHQRFTVIPKYNLIKNIGVGLKSAHNQRDYDTRLVRNNFDMPITIKKNKNIYSNIDIDNQLFDITQNGERMKIGNNIFKLILYYNKNFSRIIKKYISKYFNIRL